MEIRLPLDYFFGYDGPKFQSVVVEAIYVNVISNGKKERSGIFLPSFAGRSPRQSRRTTDRSHRW
jgi:hypothetical protein